MALWHSESLHRILEHHTIVFFRKLEWYPLGARIALIRQFQQE